MLIDGHITPSEKPRRWEEGSLRGNMGLSVNDAMLFLLLLDIQS